MKLDDLLSEISKNKKITVNKIGRKVIRVLMEVDGMRDVLMIYPETKSAEFLDLDAEWEELQAAVETEYKNLPEIKRLYNYLIENKYDIIFWL
jgi:hypothetical protein